MNPFLFRKVVYLVEATGRRAATLDEFLRAVSVIDPLSVAYHMHREFLAHKFVHSEYPNDFASWAAWVMGDMMLAERFANLVVFRFSSLEALRGEIARMTADHLLAHPEAAAAKAPAGREFYFQTARSAVMDTPFRATDLASFASALQQVPSSSIYYHLFETRFAADKGGRENDFAEWLSSSLHMAELSRKVANVDPYMFSLDEARRRVLALVQEPLEKEARR